MIRNIFSKLFPAVGLAAIVGLLYTGCKKDDANPVTPGGGGISTFSFGTAGQSVTIASGSAATKAKLTGGTLPYTVTGAPSAAVATASLSTDTLTITPVAAGTTSVTITDSNPEAGDSPRTVTLAITVSGGGGGGSTYGGNGSFLFTSSVGNLNASGTYNGNATSGQGVGTYRYSEGGYNQLAITAYAFSSPTSITVSVMIFLSQSAIVAGSYGFLPTGSSWAQMGFVVNVNPNDSTAFNNAYVMTSGTASISAITASNVQGSFSGAGIHGQNPNQTFTLSGGSFNVNSASIDALASGLPSAVEAIVRKMAQEQRLLMIK
jgi:hypothetical protein